MCRIPSIHLWKNLPLLCWSLTQNTSIFQIDEAFSKQKRQDPRWLVIFYIWPERKKHPGLVKSQGRRWRTQSWVTSEKGGIYIYICILCTKSYLDDDSKTQLKAPVVITTHQKVVAIHLMFHHFTYRRYTGAIFELAFWTIIRPPPKKRMILLDMISNISQLSTGKYMIYHMILLKRYLMDW